MQAGLQNKRLLAPLSISYCCTRTHEGLHLHLPLSPGAGQGDFNKDTAPLLHFQTYQLFPELVETGFALGVRYATPKSAATRRLVQHGSQHQGMHGEDGHQGCTQTGINSAAALARLSHSHEHEEAKDSAHPDAQVAFLEEPESRCSGEVPDWARFEMQRK